MKYKIKSRIWIEADDNILLGEGRVALLKAIEETGSLTKAAKSLKMSYKKGVVFECRSGRERETAGTIFRLYRLFANAEEP